MPFPHLAAALGPTLPIPDQTASPTGRLSDWLGRAVLAARAMLQAFTTRQEVRGIARLPRIYRGLRWAQALADLLAGRLVLPALRPVRPRPSAAFALDREPPEREHLLPNFAAAERAMLRAFATRPTGRIIAAICRDLGIARPDTLFPADLLTLADPPATLSPFAPRLPQPPRAVPPIPAPPAPTAAVSPDRPAPPHHPQNLHHPP